MIMVLFIFINFRVAFLIIYKKLFNYNYNSYMYYYIHHSSYVSIQTLLLY
jgi:hypothetical protein